MESFEESDGGLMAGYTKLFSSIVTSSVWCESSDVLRVWIAMLATCNHEGEVEGSIPGFANLARVTVPEMESAVKILMDPDSHSRTPEHDGRRIKAIPGGWKVLNHFIYRERCQGKAGSRAAYERERRGRARE